MPKLTCAFRGRVLAVHHIKDGETIIGRSADCDIQMDSLAIAPHHAKLLITGECCQLTALDSDYPLYVNGTSVTSTAVNHGDVLGIGKHSFSFSMDGIALGVRVHADETAEMATPQPKSVANLTSKLKEAALDENKTAYLQIQNGENIGRVLPLSQTLFQLGRVGGDCAIIARRFDGYYLSHLAGEQVTVNSVSVRDASILLQNGDTIKLGTTKFQFYTSF